MLFVMTVGCSKGGVGKTTTASTMAHGLALRGKRVLLMDTDAFAYATTSLGADPASGIHDALVLGSSWQDVAIEVRENLWLVPGNGDTRTAENMLIMRQESARRVADRLLDFARDFDVLVIDTPQGGLLQEASLLMATVTIVPLTVDYYGAQGLAYLSGLREIVGVGSELVILPTMYNGRSARNRSMLEKVAEFAAGSGVILSEPVPYREEVRQLPNEGKTIWESESKGHGRRVIAEMVVLYDKLIDLVMRAENATA